jgi:integrase
VFTSIDERILDKSDDKPGRYEQKQAFYSDKSYSNHSTAVLATVTGIGGHNTMDRWRDIMKQVFQMAWNNEGIRNIKDLKTEHIIKFMIAKIESPEGRAEKTIKNYISAISKGGKAVDTYFGNKSGSRQADWKAAAAWVADIHPRRRETLEKRGYKDINALFNTIKDDRYRLAAEIYYATGARASETSLITGVGKSGGGAKFNTINGCIEIIGKGGQHLTKSLPSNLSARLNAFMASEGKFTIKQSVMRNYIRSACKATGQAYMGIHGIRYTYAGDHYRDYLKSGMSAEQALLATAEDLGHHRPDITLLYLKIRY